METTRHFVATVYVVNDGATLLHEHEKLGMWLPPGGHIDRAETPHEAALRETREETGLDVDLVAPQEDIDSETARSIPKPQHFLLEDINVFDGEVGHQHIDFVFYGAAETRSLDPAPGETPTDAWEWFTPERLREDADMFASDVAEIGRRAIETVEARR
jgi:8-oxo-dGTP pyrophosphatase MutT (NUDIX family)